MTDFAKLKALAEAATPGRVHDRLDSCGGGLKYECFGDDGSLVLKVDHKNDEWGFVGDKGEADEAFFLACTPAAVLALIAENERLRADYAALATFNPDWDRVAAAQDSVREHMELANRLKAECELLRKDAEKWQIVETAMAQLQSDEQEASIWSACSRILISVAHKLNSGTSTVTEEGVTVGEEEIGDWCVTVKRIKPAMGKEVSNG